MMIIVKSMIYSVTVGNGAQSTLVTRIAVLLTLAWAGVVLAAIAFTMQPAATATVRAIPMAPSLSVSSFMWGRTVSCRNR